MACPPTFLSCSASIFSILCLAVSPLALPRGWLSAWALADVSVAAGHTDRSGLGSVLRDLVKPGDENLREMNKKLQNMLEEQLTKNMHLHKASVAYQSPHLSIQPPASPATHHLLVLPFTHPIHQPLLHFPILQSTYFCQFSCSLFPLSSHPLHSSIYTYIHPTLASAHCTICPSAP